jgi:RNA polymerase sigma factor (sigma-70 family)
VRPSSDQFGDEPEIDILDTAPNAEAQIQASEATHQVAGFIASLRPREQEIIHRLFWLGETQAAVARSLGVSRMAICKTLKKISTIGRTHLVDLYDGALLQ